MASQLLHAADAYPPLLFLQVPSRTIVQIRTHAQKYFVKLAKDEGIEAAGPSTLQHCAVQPCCLPSRPGGFRRTCPRIFLHARLALIAEAIFRGGYGTSVYSSGARSSAPVTEPVAEEPGIVTRGRSKAMKGAEGGQGESGAEGEGGGGQEDGGKSLDEGSVNSGHSGKRGRERAGSVSTAGGDRGSASNGNNGGVWATTTAHAGAKRRASAEERPRKGADTQARPRGTYNAGPAPSSTGRRMSTGSQPGVGGWQSGMPGLAQREGWADGQPEYYSGQMFYGGGEGTGVFMSSGGVPSSMFAQQHSLAQAQQHGHRQGMIYGQGVNNGLFVGPAGMEGGGMDPSAMFANYHHGGMFGGMLAGGGDGLQGGGAQAPYWMPSMNQHGNMTLQDMMLLQQAQQGGFNPLQGSMLMAMQQAMAGQGQYMGGGQGHAHVQGQGGRSDAGTAATSMSGGQTAGPNQQGQHESVRLHVGGGMLGNEQQRQQLLEQQQQQQEELMNQQGQAHGDSSLEHRYNGAQYVTRKASEQPDLQPASRTGSASVLTSMEPVHPPSASPRGGSDRDTHASSSSTCVSEQQREVDSQALKRRRVDSASRGGASGGKQGGDKEAVGQLLVQGAEGGSPSALQDGKQAQPPMEAGAGAMPGTAAPTSHGAVSLRVHVPTPSTSPPVLESAVLAPQGSRLLPPPPPLHLPRQSSDGSMIENAAVLAGASGMGGPYGSDGSASGPQTSSAGIGSGALGDSSTNAAAQIASMSMGMGIRPVPQHLGMLPTYAAGGSWGFGNGASHMPSPRDGLMMSPTAMAAATPTVFAAAQYLSQARAMQGMGGVPFTGMVPTLTAMAAWEHQQRLLNAQQMWDARYGGIHNGNGTVQGGGMLMAGPKGGHPASQGGQQGATGPVSLHAAPFLQGSGMEKMPGGVSSALNGWRVTRQVVTQVPSAAPSAQQQQHWPVYGGPGAPQQLQQEQQQQSTAAGPTSSSSSSVQQRVTESGLPMLRRTPSVESSGTAGMSGATPRALEMAVLMAGIPHGQGQGMPGLA